MNANLELTNSKVQNTAANTSLTVAQQSVVVSAHAALRLLSSALESGVDASTLAELLEACKAAEVSLWAAFGPLSRVEDGCSAQRLALSHAAGTLGRIALGGSRQPARSSGEALSAALLLEGVFDTDGLFTALEGLKCDAEERLLSRTD